MKHLTAEMRARFFNETGAMIPPFADEHWRGCALDRDTYDNTRVPQHLFEAIVSAAASKELSVCGYFPAGESCASLAPTWDAYSSYMLTHDNWSLEYVVCDQSGQWALLADADATVFGAAPELAAVVDAQLASRGTSLSQLTDSEFPGLNSVQPGGRYLLAVSGR